MPLDNTILLIDIGNSAVKWQFEGQFYSCLLADFRLDKLPKADRIFATCVGDKSLLNGLEVEFVKSPAEFGDFKSNYQNPTDLGSDRFLAMLAAISLFPEQNLLIIDAGSALTFDVIAADGLHQGGLITAGLGRLRSSFEQFKTNSKQLKIAKLASNTEQAWDFGTGQMFVDSINAQIGRSQAEFDDLRILLTGFDGKILSSKLNYSTTLEQNLVLKGLAVYVQNRQGKSVNGKV
ncbi:MAG: type III pantothenate kinase [Candidatus Thioglobus sp.]|nr:type III pantothenate kinase [Candidatus Thioglobus sp.]